jgi:hypothetical protein
LLLVSANVLGVGVIIVLETLHLVEQLRQVLDLAVLSGICVSSEKEVREDDSILVDDVFLGKLESLEGFTDDLIEVLLVVSVCQTVVEHSVRFVVEESHDVHGFLGKSLRSRADSLKEFPDVSEVEGVMGLFGCRQKFLLDGSVDFEHRLGEGFNIFGDGFWEFLQEVFGHSVENLLNHWRRHFDVSNDVEVTDKSSRDLRSTASWWFHSRKHGSILDEHELQIFSVVPSFVVHILSKDFDWGLSTIGFLLGHIQVIDKNDAFLAHGWAVIASSSLVHFRVNSVLSLVF